ncbi:hypothetical protein FGADI_12950 [Fusarium gaditjirri]|uniref:Carboxylesterase type B domain-containing protein n=1 Tax=Fusarium gaditjirri TaxID=282569 RepID=A0A8H4SQX6_9HYPO|nr:hypothetical protein FGADI_12950 [Fusarium gaditjirri]
MVYPKMAKFLLLLLALSVGPAQASTTAEKGLSYRHTLPRRTIAGVKVVNTPIVRDAHDYALKHSSDFTYKHIMRSWLFGAIVIEYNETLRNTVDLEVHAVATLLHDLGWDQTPGSPLVSHDKRFEVDGAIAAREFIQNNKHGKKWDERRVQLVWDAIALHPQHSIANYKELEVMTTSNGILSDFQGPILGITKEQYSTVLSEFPSNGMRDGLNKTMIWLSTNVLNPDRDPEPETILDDECLYVNIWVPAQSPSPPVHFYIHGGWLQVGDVNHMNMRHPIFLIQEFHCIIAAPTTAHAPGFYDFWNQRAALEWTYANITEVGGNPENISLGETLIEAVHHMKRHTFRAGTDGDFVNASFLADINSGEFGKLLANQGVDIMLGEVSNEATLYRMVSPASYYDSLVVQQSNYYPEKVTKALLQHYTLFTAGSSKDEWADIGSIVIGDCQVHATIRGLTVSLLKTMPKERILRYRISWRVKELDNWLQPSIGMCHASDIPIWWALTSYRTYLKWGFCFD